MDDPGFARERRPKAITTAAGRKHSSLKAASRGGVARNPSHRGQASRRPFAPSMTSPSTSGRATVRHRRRVRVGKTTLAQDDATPLPAGGGHYPLFRCRRRDARRYRPAAIPARPPYNFPEPPIIVLHKLV